MFKSKCFTYFFDILCIGLWMAFLKMGNRGCRLKWMWGGGWIEGKHQRGSANSNDRFLAINSMQHFTAGCSIVTESSCMPQPSLWSISGSESHHLNHSCNFDFTFTVKTVGCHYCFLFDTDLVSFSHTPPTFSYDSMMVNKNNRATLCFKLFAFVTVVRGWSPIECRDGSVTLSLVGLWVFKSLFLKEWWKHVRGHFWGREKQQAGVRGERLLQAGRTAGLR